MNKDSKSGLYLWSIIQIRDCIFDKVIAYTIGHSGVSTKISIVNIEYYQVITLGFEDGVSFYRQLDLLDMAGAKFLDEGITISEALNN